MYVYIHMYVCNQVTHSHNLQDKFHLGEEVSSPTLLDKNEVELSLNSVRILGVHIAHIRSKHTHTHIHMYIGLFL